MAEHTALQLAAKAAGVKNWWVKLAKTLEDELAELSEATVEAVEAVAEVVEEVVDVAEAVVEAVDPMAFLRALKGRTMDQAMMGIKALANKGDLWKYRELIKEEYEKSLNDK
jgi:hypothetical protein